MKISRRTFLTGISAIAALLPSKGFAGSHSFNNSAVPTFNELDHILQESWRISSTAIDVFYRRENLLNAYQLIQPTNHVESAISVWVALRNNPDNLLNEYLLRKEGAASTMFDHKVLDLSYECQPYTHRILFFNEQVYALIRKITGITEEQVARKIWLAQLPFHAEEEMSLEEFTIFATHYYAVHFPDIKDMIKPIYLLIQEGYESSLPYSLCSSIVGEALRQRG